MDGITTTTLGAIDVQDEAYVLAVFEAEELEAQARALYAKAEALRGQRRITVTISAPAGKAGFSVLTRVGGRVYSTGPASSAEEACQIAYHLIQGYQRPLRLPPFGTRVDRTLPGILEGFEGWGGSPQSEVPKN
ncbi:hypothetical protein ACIQUS_26655 [Pseudomonas sp. NPDC090755]|uniref:hypothetical protein n=1 Tax=Pseudomonas sp. NPDC090755 TaxID=3364481 RepID=UPI00383B403A